MKRFAKACAAVSMALMMSTAVGFAAETEAVFQLSGPGYG